MLISVAFTSQLMGGLDGLNISAPKNYTDPVKIAKYIQDKQNEIAEVAVLLPSYGAITNFSVFCSDSKGVLERLATSTPGGDPPAVQFVRDVLPRFESYLLDDKPGDLFVGANIKDYFRLAAAETMHFNAHKKTNIKIPAALWSGWVRAYDPYRMMFTDSTDRTVAIERWASYLGVGLPPVDDADCHARFVLQLALRMGLHTTEGIRHHAGAHHPAPGRA